MRPVHMNTDALTLYCVLCCLSSVGQRLCCILAPQGGLLVVWLERRMRASSCYNEAWVHLPLFRETRGASA